MKDAVASTEEIRKWVSICVQVQIISNLNIN